MNLRADIVARNASLRGAADVTPASGPAAAFQDALAQVSKTQQTASEASAAFERGDMTDIAQVMIARQKSSVAFEATLQVRNKLLGAYRDIMNMPV